MQVQRNTERSRGCNLSHPACNTITFRGYHITGILGSACTAQMFGNAPSNLLGTLLSCGQTLFVLLPVKCWSRVSSSRAGHPVRLSVCHPPAGNMISHDVSCVSFPKRPASAERQMHIIGGHVHVSACVRLDARGAGRACPITKMPVRRKRLMSCLGGYRR